MRSSLKNFSPKQSIGAKLLVSAVPAALLLVNVVATPAHAAGIQFQFNSTTLLTDAKNNGSNDPVAANNNSADIQAYMDAQLEGAGGNAGWYVTVAGASLTGGYKVGSTYQAGYTADNNVTCAPGGTAGCSSYTLALKDQLPVLASESNGTTLYKGKNAIEMQFASHNSTAVDVSSLSFDFEIFPNVSGPSSFEFALLAGSTLIDVTIPGITPGATAESVTNATTGDNDGTYSYTCTATNTRSPNAATDTSPQCIGTMTLTFASIIDDPTLYFVDWPPTIGVTNIDWGVPGVPEPGTLAILGSGLVGLGIIRRRRRK